MAWHAIKKTSKKYIFVAYTYTNNTLKMLSYYSYT